MQFLVERAAAPEGEPCGHALMATCPPEPFPGDDMPFGHHLPLLNGTAPKTWDITKSDLANLLDLSKRLNLDGEITPVMAWGIILSHPRFCEMRLQDMESICQELESKVRCYGYVSTPAYSNAVDSRTASVPCLKTLRSGTHWRVFSSKKNRI